MLRTSLPLVFLCLILPAAALSAQEDYRSRIAIVPMENGTGMEQYNPLCITITETVSLVLEFLKDYRVLDEQDADLGRLEEADGLDELTSAAEQEGVDEIIFGKATVQDGTFQFTLSLYNVNNREITNEQTVEAYSVLEVFDAADELTEGLIGQLSDVHIAFGSVKMVLTGGKGNYTVNLDGFPLRNPEKTFRKVLNGQYEISITQDRLTGNEVVFSTVVDVVEGEQTLVEFSLPPGLPEEYEWLNQRGSALLEMGEDESRIDEFLKEITLFQNQTLALEYDPELENLKNRFLEEAGSRAAGILQKRMVAADESFYSKKPRFTDSLNSYEDISLLVQTKFDVKMLQTSEDFSFSEPRKVLTSPAGMVYFDCSADNGQALAGWNPENGAYILKPLKKNGDSPYFQGDFAISGRRIFLWQPRESQIQILDGNFNPQQNLPVPELPLGPENFKLAVSEKGLVYFISRDMVRVVDTARQYDDEGELLPPDRYSSIESSIMGHLNRLGRNGHPSDVFFDRARHLNLYFPESALLMVLDEYGALLKEIKLDRSHPESRIAVDASGYIYISLYDENQIAKYTPGGDFVTTYGRYGTEEGEFSIPVGLSVTDDGILFVADSYNARIQSLNPLTPPVIYPEIARYNEDLDRRIERTEVAVKKEEIAKNEITLGDHFWNFLGTGTLLASSGFLAVRSDIAGAQAAYAYELYQSSTEPSNVADYRERAEEEQLVHQLTDMGSMAALGIGASLLTTTLLEIGMDSTLIRYSQRQAQVLDMNRIYETDPELYRSVRTSYRIGVWTGIVPPVLGLTSTLGLAMGQVEVSPELVVGLTAMGVGIPPIFSHLHGGRFSVGLLLSGLAADALVLGAVANLDHLMNFDPWDAQRYYSYESPEDQANIDDGNADSSFIMNRMMDRLGEVSAMYFLIAAYGIRITAGIFDARYGWTYTNNYNRYKAVRPLEEESRDVSSLDWGVSPFLNREGNLGMAVSLFY